MNNDEESKTFHCRACGECGKVNGNASDCFRPQCITADGLQRGVMSINRQIPGPAIHVCQNDRIVVDVANMMAGTTSTIHWHGFHQRESPWMDGVPFITQCPIDFATTFRYSFNASEAGTQFFHSHTGHHKVNGHYGGLVVRRPNAEDPNRSLYDHDLKEHLIIASDWMDNFGEMFTPGLPTHKDNLMPTSFLINGRGTVVDVSKSAAAVQINHSADTNPPSNNNNKKSFSLYSATTTSKTSADLKRQLH
jgi:FtsP/CotA-like multicopper oxidase with cupredoxin domain